MKKARNILLIILGIGSLILIGFMIFIGTAIGKRAKNIQNKYLTQTELRDLTVFEFGSLVRKADYELSICERDSVIIYNYRNLNDSTKNKDFRYLKHSDRLLAGPFEFEKIENHNYPILEAFKYYDSDSGIMDGMGPVIFNDDFGVLGFDNGMGTQYYFTNDLTKNIDLPILYKRIE